MGADYTTTDDRTLIEAAAIRTQIAADVTRAKQVLNTASWEPRAMPPEWVPPRTPVITAGAVRRTTTHVRSRVSVTGSLFDPLV